MNKKKFNKIMTGILILSFAVCFCIAGFSYDKADAIDYLNEMQKNDGGIGSEKSEKGETALTCWAIMGLSAAGENLDSSKWEKNNKSLFDFLDANADIKATTDYSRTLIALEAAGKGSKLGNQDIAEKLKSFQKLNGQFSQFDQGEQKMINAHVWAVLALKAAEEEIPKAKEARAWLINQQNRDGGFSWIVGGESDPDSTAVAINALLALGAEVDDESISKALNYISQYQGENGGIGWTQYKENTATNAWVLQSLNYLEYDGELIDKKKLENHLESFQTNSGYFNWTEGRKSSSILMTSYAMVALEGKYFPVVAKENNTKPEETMDEIRIIIDEDIAYVNNIATKLDAEAIIRDGRTYVPLRFIGEALGINVEWDGPRNTAILKGEGINLEIKIGDGGQGFIYKSRSMVPVRFVSENLKRIVDWNGDLREVTIKGGK